MALENIRVMDLTRLLPGEYCTMLLADLGAEVLKVEEPTQGDYARWMPPFIKGESALFLTLNRNKRSMKLNLKNPLGREVFLKLAASYDVLIEGNRPGVMDRLGLGYDKIKEINPKIVYCSLSGYGQDGPYRDYTGHDVNYCGYGGIMGLMTAPDGEPVIPGVQIADLGGGGMLAAISILAALMARERTGKGQYTDVSMLDGVVSWVGHLAAQYFADGLYPGPGVTRLRGGLPSYGVYKTKDGRYVTLGALEEKFWVNFCRAIEREDLIPYHRADGEESRRVKGELSRIFMTKTMEEWVSFLAHKDICFGPVYTFEEVFEDPQVRGRGMVQSVGHPTVGRHKVVSSPVKLSDTPAAIRRGAPLFGEHTEEVLRSLGYGPGDIERMRKEKVI